MSGKQKLWRASAGIKQRAKQLRRQETHAEKLLWQQLRGRKFCNLKFRRQHPIGRFIVDFFCSEVKLVIEIDGPVHLDRVEHDNERTQILEGNGLKVIRFLNQEVESDIVAVLDHIKQALDP